MKNICKSCGVEPELQVKTYTNKFTRHYRYICNCEQKENDIIWWRQDRLQAFKDWKDRTGTM